MLSFYHVARCLFRALRRVVLKKINLYFLLLLFILLINQKQQHAAGGVSLRGMQGGSNTTASYVSVHRNESLHTRTPDAASKLVLEQDASPLNSTIQNFTDLESTIPEIPSTGFAGLSNFSIAGFQLLQLLGHGGHSIGFLVEGTEKFYTEHGFTSGMDRRLVLKLGYRNLRGSDAHQAELESLTRMASNKTKAKEVGALPLYFHLQAIPNPFDCDGNNIQSNKVPRLPQFSEMLWMQICRRKNMSIMVVAYKTPELLFDRQRTMKEYVTFLRSLLQQLELAHSNMVSNNDLNPEKNIYVDERTGGAVLFDWNYGMVYPDYMLPGNATVRDKTPCSLTPPEGIARLGYGFDIQFYSIHANDIWQVGKIFSNILYRPCVWACEILDDQDIEQTLPKIIHSLGGRTAIPMNNTHEIDLAEMLELPSDVGNTTTFHPILQQGWEIVSECPTNSSWYLDDPDVSEVKKGQAIDLLRRMLSISPYDRPPSGALLQHPFLN